MQLNEHRLLIIASCFGIAALALVLGALFVGRLAPDDAADTTDVAIVDTDDAAAPEPETHVYVTTMTHMEGSFQDDTDEALFLRHVAQMRWAMDLFDEYGMKLTFESEQSFAKANTTWGLNMLKEVVERGHGVGTHADFGAESVAKSTAFYVRAFEENKALVDALAGAEHNRGISGGIGAYDWATAMSRAGFSYVDGVVGFAYLAMPESERPDGWTDEYIRSTAFHTPVPLDFSLRARFYELTNADDFTPDGEGITISGGETAEFSKLAEDGDCRSCPVTTEDADAFFAWVREAEAVRTEYDEPTKVNVHIPLVLFTESNEAVLRYFLAGLEELVAEVPSIRLATQGEAYDGYLEWRSAR
ncbi:hypothetical protein HYS28_01095 [Candidatus Uhrbacteria bacterium]|nr:hypothetical protein [Candidatus Uhrbacteria bacterium]